jgi:hypothetical protein
LKRLLLAGAAALALASSAAAQDQPHNMASMPGMDMSHADTPAQTPDPTGGMAGMSAHDMAHMNMPSALGGYGMSRDASGTSWQPDASVHDGLHLTPAGWTVMVHGLLNGVYDNQSGPRGGTKAFAAGMLMGMASHEVGPTDTVQFRAMLSPDPAMGPSGYPLLLATGETADGKTPLVDRQHPHDLFMELSGSYSRRLDPDNSVYVYAGLPGEPAFGPPAFMHRMSTQDSPEAPITHHWLDSTHITFGVLTAGWTHDNFKIEASSFRGREPDQHRLDIESPKLDSESFRASWNPTKNWSLQASWAHLTSPEQLDPDTNEDRWSTSAVYTVPFGKDGWWSSTAAFGSKTLSDDHRTLNGWLLETALKPTDPWTVFARAEGVENEELLTGHQVERVAKISAGAIHDWRVAPHIKMGLGALYAFDFVPSALSAAYGDDPRGGMAFVRLKLD